MDWVGRGSFVPPDCREGRLIETCLFAISAGLYRSAFRVELVYFIFSDQHYTFCSIPLVYNAGLRWSVVPPTVLC